MKIESSHNTPYVNLSLEENVFEISGHAFSDKINDIFSDILEWIDTEIPKLSQTLVCEIKLDVFSSVTYKNLFNVLQKLEAFVTDEGKDIRIKWYSDPEDGDNYDMADDIRDLYDLPFEIVLSKK